MRDSPLEREADLPGPSVLGFLACGTIVRREAYLQAGGFDPLLFFFGEEELLAPGADGIHGVRLANAIHLSSWTGQEVSLEDFDEDAYLAQLNERISAEGKFETRS